MCTTARPPCVPAALHCKWQSQWRTGEPPQSGLTRQSFPREAVGNMHAAIVGNMHGNRARVFAEYLPAILGLFARPSEDFRDRVCAKRGQTVAIYPHP